jgi:hypothetical protein
MTWLLAFQCVQCARTAAAQGEARLAILWQGVEILLVPPLVIFGGTLYALWRRGRQADALNAAGGTGARPGPRL